MGETADRLTVDDLLTPEEIAEAERRDKEDAAEARAQDYCEYIEETGLLLSLVQGSKGASLVNLLAGLNLNHPTNWLNLAGEIGPVPVMRLLESGKAGIGALNDVKRAVELRADAARDNKRWLSAEGRGIPSKKKRIPILTVGEPSEGKNRDPYLPGGIVGLVVAAGGMGKTTWLAELAMRVAFGGGGETYPPYTVRNQGPVMLLLAEEDEEGLDKALYRGLQKALGDDADNLAEEKWKSQVFALAGADRDTSIGLMVTTADPVRGQTTSVVPSPLLEALIHRAREIGPLLTILDPINQLLPTGSSENDAVAAKAMIALSGMIRAAAEDGVRRRWADKTGEPKEDYNGPRPVVLLAHHERKRAGNDAGADASRGSSAFVDNARWVMRMTREKRGEEERAQFTVVKSNYTRWWNHQGVVGYESNGLAWRKETPEEEARWRELGETNNKEKWSAQELADKVRLTGAGGMARSKAERKALAGAVEEAIKMGRVVSVERSKGNFTLYAKGKAPTFGDL